MVKQDRAGSTANQGIVSRLAAGESPSQIANDLGVTPRWVRKVGQAAGLERPRRTPLVDRAVKVEKRIREGAGAAELSREFGVDPSAIIAFAKTRGLPLVCKRRRLAVGNRLRTSRGYIRVYMPEHPRAQKPHGYVLEHVLVAEKALGKSLPRRAQVHHINGQRDDNRNENLVVCEDAAYHSLLHTRARKLGFEL